MVLGVGLVGLWGHEIYARELAANRAADLLGVAGWLGADEAMNVRLDAFAAEHRVPHLADLDELSQEGGLEAVLIMVPPQDNVALCVAALDRGLDVLCEKPIAGSPADLVALAEAIERAPGVFTACYPIARYEPRIEALAGQVGQVTRACFTYLAGNGPQYCAPVPHYRDPDLPDGALMGGEAAMFSGYGVIALEHLIGARIATVQASLGCGWYPPYRERRQEDLARVELTFANGATGALTLGRTPMPGPAEVVVELVGERGYADYRSPRDGAAGAELAEPFIEDFVVAARSGLPPTIAAKDVLSAAAVLEAIYRSAARSQALAVARG